MAKYTYTRQENKIKINYVNVFLRVSHNSLTQFHTVTGQFNVSSHFATIYLCDKVGWHFQLKKAI